MADQVYIMYHGTKRHEWAALIEQDGFKPSTGGLLGPGVYVSRDIRKAQQLKGTGVILEVMVRVGKVCHIKDHEVPVPVGDKWKELKRSNPGAVQEMKAAKDLVAPGWSEEAPWHDAGYDTAWVPEDVTASVFKGGIGWSEGIKEETCIYDPSRISVLKWVEWDTDRSDLNRFQWMWLEDSDRVAKHAEADGTWVAYSRKNSIMIESHYLARGHGGRSTVIITIENGRKLFHEDTGMEYEIDLDGLTQRNVMTNFTRRLRRRDCRLLAAVTLQCAVREMLARFEKIKRTRAAMRIQRWIRKPIPLPPYTPIEPGQHLDTRGPHTYT